MNARIPCPRHPIARAAASLLGLLALAAPPAGAQTAPAAKADAVQVVEVTAQGRRQEVQQVPISVQLINPEQIEKLAASNLAQVADFIPGLSIDATEPTQPSYSIRGLGNSDFGIGTDSPVGVYVNGVYTGKTGGALLNFNDVKRVELLKGPQGTLFGRNSAGGAIAIITNDPDSTFSGSGLVRAGSQGTLHAEGRINQPLGEDFALRLSAVSEQSDGWATNVADGKKMPQSHSWGTRLGLRFAPSTETSAVINGEHENLNQRPRPIWAISTSTPTFDTSPASFTDPRHLPLANDVVGGRETRDFDGLNLRIEHDAGAFTITSTTGWRHFKTANLQDNDGTANIASYLATGNYETSTSLEQDLRFAGRNKTADWLVGLSYYDERARQESQVNVTTNSIDTLLGNTFGVPVFATLNQIAQLAGVPGIDLLGQSWQEGIQNTGNFRSTALYGDVIWHLDAQTNLTTGARFTTDSKKFSWYNPLRSAPGLDPQLAVFSPEFFQALVDAEALDPQTAGLLSATVQQLQTTNLEFNNPEWATAPQYTTKTWHNTSPRLVLDHHVSPDSMVYASVTRGYQAGGFNSVSTQANGGRFDPETVTSIELGAKGRVPAERLTWSAALFDYQFKNLQSITLDHSTAIPTYVVTTSDVKATGMDVDAQWQPSAATRVFGAVEYIDQLYKGQRNVAPEGHRLTGQPYGTPQLSLALGMGYQWSIADGQADFTLQGRHQSPQRCNADSVDQGSCLTAPTFKVGEARNRVDTRLGWDAASGRWGVALVVNNLLNKQYVNWLSNLAAPVGVPFYASVTDPRKVLVELRAKL